MMLFGLIFLVFVAFYMFNSSNAGAERSCCANHQSQVNTPMDLLNERYARGEINREDYLERKQELFVQKQTISIKKR